MIFTALCIFLFYFSPAILYLFVEIERRNSYRFLGRNYHYRDYILQVCVDALNRALVLVADLLQDLSFPLLRFANVYEERIWRIMLLASHQLLMYSVINLVTVFLFLPLELIVLRLRDRQRQPY